MIVVRMGRPVFALLTVLCLWASASPAPARADLPPPPPPRPEVPEPPPGAPDPRLPGVALAEGITQITGVAISPLLGVSGVGAWEYFTTDAKDRALLPWFCHPAAWGAGFVLLSLVLLKDLAGAGLPAILKKPLDIAELFESKLSAIVAGAALVPFLDRRIAEVFAPEPASAPSAAVAGTVEGLATIPPLLASSPTLWLALLVPLSLIAFFAVWLSSHALNVLLLLSPFGILDLVLKAARFLFLGFLVLLSAIAPVLAGILCGLLILLALWVAPQAFRLCVFGTVMSVDFVRSLVRRSIRSDRTVAFLARRAGPTLGALSYGVLEAGPGGPPVFRSRFLFFGPTRSLTLPEADELDLEKGLIFPSLRHHKPGSKRTETLFHLLPRHRHDLAEVAVRLGINRTVDPPVIRGIKAAFRRVAESLPRGSGSALPFDESAPT